MNISNINVSTTAPASNKKKGKKAVSKKQPSSVTSRPATKPATRPATTKPIRLSVELLNPGTVNLNRASRKGPDRLIVTVAANYTRNVALDGILSTQGPTRGSGLSIDFTLNYRITPDNNPVDVYAGAGFEYTIANNPDSKTGLAAVAPFIFLSGVKQIPLNANHNLDLKLGVRVGGIFYPEALNVHGKSYSPYIGVVSSLGDTWRINENLSLGFFFQLQAGYPSVGAGWGMTLSVR